MKKYCLKVFFITSLIIGVILSLCIVAGIIFMIYALSLSIPNMKLDLKDILLVMVIITTISIIGSGPKILFWSLDKLKNMK